MSTGLTEKRKKNHQIDFSSWARKAYWTPIEAAALSLSGDPDDFRSMSPDEMEQVLELSNLHDRVDDIERFVKASGEQFVLSPIAFLTWALSMQLDIPPALREAIEHVSGSADDWKTKYGEARAKAEELQLRLTKCESELAELKKHEREEKRLSLQKLVVGMAIAKYGYISAPRHTVASIVGDLNTVRQNHAGEFPYLSSIELDNGTVSKFLNAAAKELEEASSD